MQTYVGLVKTPADATLIFEACRQGILPRIQRRLSDRERNAIRSGSVFVWDEREAGMRRWTDGKSWSASRVAGSFLTYREMEGKRTGANADTASKEGATGDDSDDMQDGSESYKYKADGLVKQSFSITTSEDQRLHLISYYGRSHPHNSSLRTPSTDPSLAKIQVPRGLYPESSAHDLTDTRSDRPHNPSQRYIVPQTTNGAPSLPYHQQHPQSQQVPLPHHLHNQTPHHGQGNYPSHQSYAPPYSDWDVRSRDGHPRQLMPVDSHPLTTPRSDGTHPMAPAYSGAHASPAHQTQHHHPLQHQGGPHHSQSLHVHGATHSPGYHPYAQSDNEKQHQHQHHQQQQQHQLPQQQQHRHTHEYPASTTSGSFRSTASNHSPYGPPPSNDHRRRSFQAVHGTEREVGPVGSVKPESPSISSRLVGGASGNSGYTGKPVYPADAAGPAQGVQDILLPNLHMLPSDNLQDRPTARDIPIEKLGRWQEETRALDRLRSTLKL